jgi:predicted nucleic acid-binding protein
MPLCEVFPDPALYSQALSISGEMGIGFYDALIVSSASGAGARILWSEDMQHGTRVRGLEIRDPFRE